MKGLIKFSVDHPVSITMLVGIMVVMGLLSVSQMGQDLLPDVSFPTVTVVTSYSGASPQEVERLITEPVEEACAMISGVQKVSSVSSEGVSTVTVEFQWGTDVDVASQDVREKLGLIEDYLPDDASRPGVYKFDPSMIPVVEYSFYSDKYTPSQLKKIVEDVVKPRLERQEGVASVSILGVEDQNIVVDVDMAKLREQGLGLGDVIQMLRAQNLNLPAGHYMLGPKEYLIRAVGEIKSPDDLLDAPVGITKAGRPVILSDVAKVWVGIPDSRTLYQVEGLPGVDAMVLKQSGSNVVNVADRIDRQIEEVKAFLPAGVQVAKSFDMSEAVRSSNRSTLNAAWQGSLLAALVVFLFLFNWRPTLVISLAIPLSVVASFILMKWRGDTLNMMTLGGLTLAIGMLVDNAVVVVENIFRHMEEGQDRKTAAVEGTREVGLAIIASTLTNVVVFLPLIYTGGVTGEIMQSMAITVIITLLVSLFVAITIIPSYGAQLFKVRASKQAYEKAWGSAWFKHVARLYEAGVRWVLRHRVLTTGAVSLIGLVSLFVFSRIGAEFMPHIDRSFMSIEVKLPSGTPPDATKDYLDQLLRLSQDYDEIETRAVLLGSEGIMGMFGGTPDVNQGILYMSMTEPETRSRTSTEIAEEIIQRAPPYQGARISVPNYEARIMGGGAPVEVHIYGKDIEVLNQLAQQVLEKVKAIPGVVQADISMEMAKPEIKVKVDRQRAAYYGLTPYQIEQEIEAATKGKTATRMEIEGDQLDVVVRADPEKGLDLNNLWIKTPMGSMVPLSEVAEIAPGLGPTKIERENQVRMVKVTGDKYGRNLSAVNRDVEAALKSMSFPPGYSWEIAGEAQRMKDMMTQMGWVMLAAIILTYMIMAALFESFKRPLVVMFTVPVAFIGVAFALWLTGTVISMTSLMGMLIVFGVVVNNAIVMVDLIDQLRNKGMEAYDALIRGATLRLRPILITALTTMLGLLPMAVSRTRGWEMRAPTAIALIGGLFTGTFVTLFVIPMVYSWFERIKTKPQGKKA